ncbi:hypothetical protein SEPCBS119000_003520 [Sporothrix epigloea]|uniref:COP9 signalosome complex subunit 3 N-terminal helical repeats domain-containing protein n=1 Tax=Sporothrix epigloea TaxID=1892477 RepID=A0ABP0DRB2_9PEZI
MEQVADVLLHFPPPGQDVQQLADDAFDAQIKIHAHHIQKLFKESVHVIAANATELLDCLDPAVHTYSYLSLLDTAIPTDYALYPSVPPVIVSKIVALLAVFDPRQVRYIGSAFTHVFTVVGSGKIIPAPLAVQLLSRALQAVDPSGHMLTSNHLTLAKLAYHTRNPAAALPILSKDVVFFPGAAHNREVEYLCSRDLAAPWYISKDTGLTLPLRSAQVLEFDFTVGLLHLSTRAWAAAHAAFARVVAYPSRDTGVSKFMVEAHKFWVLTGLLLYGRVAATPPETAGAVSRVCSSVNKLYLQIADHFQSANVEKLRLEVAMAQEVLVADGTASLVGEVVSAYPKWQIAHLRNVYLTIPISAIRATLQQTSNVTGTMAGLEPQDDVAGFSEAEVTALIQEMIASGMIKAVLRSAETIPTAPASTATAAASSSTIQGTPIEVDGGQPQPGVYLEFLPEEEDISESDFATRIAAIKMRLQTLQKLQRTTDEHLSLNRDYVRHVVRSQTLDKDSQGEDDMGGLMAIGSSEGIGLEDPDEDLMMDGPDPSM